ncbi:polysaccharide export outer membrane protein [Methylomonas methanica]|uniref:Polysaccharide export outer membrane protein n=1 Tax=Methylomonas methanica TaxID=421 RepID=A0ABY2CRZ4_METMH|nr:polysaccharide export outer membrane protein [Methylomonas methanica]
MKCLGVSHPGLHLGSSYYCYIPSLKSGTALSVGSERTDCNLNNIIKEYILKQIITLFSFCLLCSTTALAEPETQIPPAPPIEPLNAATSPAPTVTIEQTNYAAYQLSPGDALEITVWKEEGMQQLQILISPDGTIIFPLIGTVGAAGKTITELKDNLTSRLADYISDPSITVKLLNNQGNSIFVIGKVNKPGQVFSGRRLDVLQALSLAGGLTVFAKEGSISIIRRTGDQVKVFPFDYSDVIDGESLEQNILLEPGDTVTVP